MAILHFFNVAGKRLTKFTSACSLIKVSGTDTTNKQIRKQFSPGRQGTSFYDEAKRFYAQLLAEKAGVGGAFPITRKNCDMQTFCWLAEKFLNEHLIPHTRSRDDAGYVKTLILKWGKYKLTQIHGPEFRKWIWHALDHPIKTAQGKCVQYVATTVTHLVAYGRRIYSWGISEGLIRHNPLTRVLQQDPALCREIRRRISQRRHETIVIPTIEEFWSFMKYLTEPSAQGPRGRTVCRRAAILSAYGGGMRIDEVCHLRWSQVDENRVVFSAADDKETKEKVVYLEQEAVDILREAEIEQITLGGLHKYVLINESGLRMNKRSLTRSWKRYRERYAAKTNNVKWLLVTFHRLRNTYRTRKAMETNDIHAIARNMGHHNMPTSFLYDVVDEARLQKLTNYDSESFPKVQAAIDKLVAVAVQNNITYEDVQGQLRLAYRDHTVRSEA